MQPMFSLPFPDGSYLLQKIQTFSTPGTHTYTPTSDMIYCIIQCQAPGGGGGAANATIFGGPGGGGGYSQLLASAAAIGTSQSITIGTAGSGAASSGQNGFNGGTTSVGALLSCIGGQGGAGGDSGGSAGIGGQAFGGNLNISGQAGYTTIASVYLRAGGGSYLGFGAQRDTGTPESATLGIGGSYGGGGLPGPNGSGGAKGGPGVVVITEYIPI